MLPASLANGEYQQAQQHFQPSQSSLLLTQTSVGSCQGGTTNRTVFGSVNRDLNAPSVFIYQNGIWERAQMVTQVGNGHLVNNATTQGQVATLQHVHQNSHQNMPAHVNQIVLSHGNQLQSVQNGILLSNNDHQNIVHRKLHHNAVGLLTMPLSAHNTSSPSASIQIAQKQNYSQSTTQNLSSTPQIRHNVQQLPINSLATTNSLPNYHTSNSSYVNSGGVATTSINMNLTSQNDQQVSSLPIPQPNYNLLHVSKNEPATTNTLPNKPNCQNSRRTYMYGTRVVASSSRNNSKGNQYEAKQLANPFAGTDQHILRQQSMNSGENNSLKVPYQTHNGSSFGSSPFVSKETRLESNEAVQPVVYSTADICESNPLIAAMLTNQPSVQNTRNIPTSQISTDTLPRQSFASKNLGGMHQKSIPPSAGGRTDALNRDNIKPKPQLSTERECERHSGFEMLFHLFSNDNSIHSSGHTVQKAVAVVPPLSQKKTDITSKNTSSIKQRRRSTEVDKSLPEDLKEGSLHLTDNCKTSAKTSDRSRKSRSTPVASSEVAQSQNTSQKVVSISDEGPESLVNVEMNRVIQPCLSEVLTKNSETPADPKLSAYDLSSIPTVQWKVKNLLDHIDSVQSLCKVKTQPGVHRLTLLQMFWGNTVDNLRHFCSNCYKDIISCVNVYIKGINPNTVILSEVKEDFVKLLDNYYVLKHDEVYESGFPYVSSWLNTNEKLDDIDKEFGYPMFLRTHRINNGESQQDCTSINTNVDISNETPKKLLSQMDLKAADSHKEESHTDENSSKQYVSPTKSSADSSDPHYSFGIEVLSPEEAKSIFEKNEIQLKEDVLPQKTTESCTNGDSSSNVKSSHKTSEISEMEQICCLSKWMESLLGYRSDLISTCQCKADPVGNDCTERKFSSAEQAQVEENSDNSVTSNFPEIENAFILNDFLGAGGTSQGCEPFHDGMDSSNSSFNYMSENKDQEQVPNQMHNPWEDPELAPIESPGSSEYCTSEGMENKTEIATSDDSSSEMDSDCIQPELEPTEMPESPMEEGDDFELAPIESPGSSESCTSEEIEKNPVIVSSDDSSSEFDLNCELLELEQTDMAGPPMEEKGDPRTHTTAALLSLTGPSLNKKDIRTAELVLFGSTSLGTCHSIRPMPSSAMLPPGAPKPPKTLSVDIEPMELITSKTIKDNFSVKRQIYEKWRSSLPPAAIGHNKTNMLKKLSVHHASFMKTNMLTSTSTKTRSLSLDVHDRKKAFRSLKKRRKSQLPKPTVHQSHGVVDPHEDGVLGFSVLPRTFSFQDESNNINTGDDVTEKTLLSEAHNERSIKSLKKATAGAWYPKPAKMYCPLRPTMTSGVFHEFQRRYMKKTQKPTDA